MAHWNLHQGEIVRKKAMPRLSLPLEPTGPKGLAYLERREESVTLGWQDSPVGKPAYLKTWLWSQDPRGGKRKKLTSTSCPLTFVLWPPHTQSQPQVIKKIWQILPLFSKNVIFRFSENSMIRSTTLHWFWPIRCSTSKRSLEGEGGNSFG